MWQRVAGAKQTFRLKFQLENILVPFMRIYWQKFVEQSPELVVPHGGVGHEPDEKPQQHAQGIIYINIYDNVGWLFVCDGGDVLV